jgi:PhoH-like protein
MLEAMDILGQVNGISFIQFDETDVVRHHLVQRIIRAYDDYKTRMNGDQMVLLPINGKAGRNGSQPAVEVAAPEPEPAPEQVEE